MACASYANNVVRYSRGKVKQSIQGNFQGIGDNIANQLYKEIKLHFGKKG
jgi:hypothetical protein